MLLGQSDGRNPLIEVPASKVTIVFAQFTRKLSVHHPDSGKHHSYEWAYAGHLR